MAIIFYSMPGCGHCVKAKNELKDEISNNKIIMRDSSNAPSGVRGFPHFTNSTGKKSVTGFPGKENLFMQLGYSGGGVKRQTKKQKKVTLKKKLNKWQKFLKKNSGKGWTITKMKNEYKKL